MTFFKWEDKYSTNIGDMDRDHQKLMDLVNSLYSQVFECEDIEEERALTEKTLLELIEYTQYHFQAEEELMQKYGYQGYDEHKEAHTGFIKEIHKLFKDHNEGGMALSFPIFVFIKDWISNHILITDKKYSAALAEKGVL